ncbi:hypothetical protein E1286_13595 [Nonomuraea terrae]|uniref:Uncharacterized protein n=1 Tax=Nonomuraea terrae TaxID=2530383 RepID=A0A4R4YVS1_9ACTN|nr:hypothetical protein [Nonomuraea terrae]TDD49525.1 hypothetical protein E1286_13595 [Nonomuraea terrae]
MTTNIGTQQEYPKAPWWAAIWAAFMSSFKRPRREGGGTPDPLPQASEVESMPDAAPQAIEKNAAEESMAEIKAALQRIEDALLRLPAPAPTTSAQHHVGEILLTFVEAGRWNQLWAHQLLEDPKGNAEEHVPGAILLARTVLKHHDVPRKGPAEALKKWAGRGEADPAVQDPGQPPSPSPA